VVLACMYKVGVLLLRERGFATVMQGVVVELL